MKTRGEKSEKCRAHRVISYSEPEIRTRETKRGKKLADNIMPCVFLDAVIEERVQLTALRLLSIDVTIQRARRTEPRAREVRTKPRRSETTS